MAAQMYWYPQYKEVMVYPTKGPILSMIPPIRVPSKRIYDEYFMRECFDAGASIGEIMPDGSEIMLTVENCSSGIRGSKGFQENPPGMPGNYFNYDIDTPDADGDGVITNKDYKILKEIEESAPIAPAG